MYLNRRVFVMRKNTCGFSDTYKTIYIAYDGSLYIVLIFVFLFHMDYYWS